MKKKILLLLCCITFANGDVGKHNIGLGAGFVTGLGISYRQWFNNGFGFQINEAPVINIQKDYKDVFNSLGVVGLKKISISEYVNLIGYAGVHWIAEYYENTIYYYYEPITMEPINKPEITRKNTFFFGGGPGIDIHFWKISFNIMTGLKGDYVSKKDYGGSMTIESALYYSF